MYRYRKAFAAFAIVLAATTAATASARADDRSTFECSRRVERGVQADAAHRDLGHARHFTPTRPVTNDAVLADGVTIDGG